MSSDATQMCPVEVETMGVLKLESQHVTYRIGLADYTHKKSSKGCPLSF